MDLETIKELLNLPEIEVSKVRQTPEEVLIWVHIPDGRHRCPRCGRLHAKVTEVREIKVRDLSIFGKTCYLIVSKGRLHCPCSYRGYEALDFVNSYQKQTTRFNEFLFALCDRMTVMDAAGLMKVDWKRAYHADRQGLEQLKASVALPKMTFIGVDEIAFEKHHRYFTIVYDLADGNGTLYVGKDRTCQSLSDFFESLTPTQRESIQVVSMDMWDPYIRSVRQHLPHADIVFDRFHIKKHLNQSLDALRRSVVRHAPLQEKPFVKNKRWVLLKNQSNHTVRDKRALEQLKQINSPLYEAYLVKEQFDQFFTLQSEAQGKEFLKNWFEQIPQTLQPYFKTFYNMINRYLYGILTFFKHRITNAVAEGLNNKIKVLKRMAYGYRDYSYFQLKILRKCGYLKQASPVF